jgi:hypothetical protein
MSLFAEPVFQLHAGSTVLAERVFSLDSVPPECPAVRTLFGARQIARLERLEAQALEIEARDAVLDELGYANDPARAPRQRPVYAENAHAEGSIVHQLLVRESLRFGLVCSATAFVGERIEAGRRVEASVQVPSALPSGWSAGFAQFSVAAATPVPAPAAPKFRAMRAPEVGAHPPQPTRSMVAPTPAAAPPVLRFRGVPQRVADSTVLVQGVAGRDIGVRLSRLWARLGRGEAVGNTIELWICEEDASRPLVRIKLHELISFGGERPLNVAVAAGTRVLVVLRLPDDGWSATAGELELELS